MTKFTKETEKVVADRESKRVSGKREVKCAAGTIDILTEKEIIEVKYINQWKSALGQIIAYGSEYPSHQKRLHLYGECQRKLKVVINSICEKQDIIVSYAPSALVPVAEKKYPPHNHTAFCKRYPGLAEPKSSKHYINALKDLISTGSKSPYELAIAIFSDGDRRVYFAAHTDSAPSCEAHAASISQKNYTAKLRDQIDKLKDEVARSISESNRLMAESDRLMAESNDLTVKYPELRRYMGEQTAGH